MSESQFDGPAEDVPATPSPGLISSASAPAPSQVSSAWSESEDKANAAPAPAPEQSPVTPTILLSPIEARVLGCLVEKSFLTPDVYPMTTNALVGACNQKTNRDPVVSFSAVEVDATLLELRQRELVRRVHAQGSRSTKHRQTLDEALSLSPSELVLLSVLLLRGAQTMGELRTRTERHQVGFDSLESIEACLDALARRPTALVTELARQPGQKENRWMHLLADEEAAPQHAAAAPATPAPAASVAPVAQAASVDGGGAASPAPAASAPSTSPSTSPSADELTGRVRELETQVATLRRQLSALADKLGEPLD